MGILSHWYVVVIIVVVAVLLISPTILPRLGRRFGQRMRQTGDASVEAGKVFKAEITRTDTSAAQPESEVETPPSL